MIEVYIIHNLYHDLYYHSITPRGVVLWCEKADDAQHLTEDEAELVVTYIEASISICKYEDLRIDIL